MKNTIPKNALVAVPDFNGGALFRILPAEQAVVSVFDRSFLFGDSLYEVTRSYGGILFSLEEHMQRLKRSSEMALWDEMPDFELISQMIRQTCRQFFTINGNRDVYIRVVTSRGQGDLNIDPSCSSSPYSYVFVKEMGTYPESYYKKGLHYRTSSFKRNHPETMNPAIKSGNYLNNVLALHEAKMKGADDALMLSINGFVTEGTTNNFFAVKNGEIWTAPLSLGILRGITRDWIFEICRNVRLPIQERLFTLPELTTADEMFMSSATKEIVPITKLNGSLVGKGTPGPITLQLAKEMKHLIATYSMQHRAESLFV
ncbi:MAG: aminotransferase class IV [Bacteriovoracia bacterium]